MQIKISYVLTNYFLLLQIGEESDCLILLLFALRNVVDS